MYSEMSSLQKDKVLVEGLVMQKLKSVLKAYRIIKQEAMMG